MKWSAKEKKIAKELYELAMQRDYDNLMSDIKKRVPKKREDVWALQKFLNEQAKEFNKVYQFKYSYLLEKFVYLVRKGLLSKKELQSLGEEKFTYIIDILKVLVPHDSTEIYQLKTVLNNTKPTIYRTIEIKEDATFFDLHMVIQILFDWHNAHLHEFRKEDLVISDPEFFEDMYEFEDEQILNEKEIKISDILKKPKDRVGYLYDFGDSWEHTITLEKIIDAQDAVIYPRCIRAKRCAPPEDVGGVWGFEEFKEAIKNSDHEEYENYKEWYDGEFDLELVNFQNINRQLENYAKRNFN